MYMILVLRMDPCFEPGDCDVYLACRTYKQFLYAIMDFGLTLNSMGISYVKDPVDKPCRNFYGTFEHDAADNGGDSFWITDFKVAFYKTEFKISLVWHKGATEVMDYIKGYDIDIVKGCIKLEHTTPKFHVPPDVHNSIHTKVASVIREFDISALNSHAVGSLAQTLHRMSKYRSRGFRFLQLPKIIFSPPPTFDDKDHGWLLFDDAQNSRKRAASSSPIQGGSWTNGLLAPVIAALKKDDSGDSTETLSDDSSGPE